MWDYRYGGSDNDWIASIQHTTDGGFILGGHSNSGISGDKSQACWGNWDYWIVKTDSLGIKQWDKVFGGTDDDFLFSIQQTSDGGFILGGRSGSGISGDKSQASWGSNDYWIVKTDSLGNKQWDKDFGGTSSDELYSIQQTSDGGFILGGRSASGISGDKTQPLWGGAGDFDYWMVKTDVLGNKLWDKDFGGTDYEGDFGNLTLTSDGGFLLAGTSYSPISGDKTEANLGSEQSWVVKTDSSGNKQCDKTLLTLGHDEAGYAIETSDQGCYLMANITYGGIGGNKTQVSRGFADYWIIKFCDTTGAVPITAFTAPPNICPGTCTDFTNLSFNATSYLWSFPGATPDTSTASSPTNICYANPGTYDVQLIATNANGSDTLLLANYITVHPTPQAQSITQSGDTLFAIAGATTYQWYFNGNLISGATDYFYIAPASGDYNVVATDGNGCEVEAAVFNVVAGLTPALSKGEGVMVFPNPVGDLLTIGNGQIGIKSVSIYNTMEELLLAGSLLTAYCQLPTCTIDVSHLPSGLYFLEVNTIDDKKIFRAKFIKQ